MFGKSLFCLLSVLVATGSAVRCYQCSSGPGQEPKGEDNCGAYRKFNTYEHTAIECSSDESTTPGSFCMKVVQQGPKGFILGVLMLLGDGRWRQVIRRCASVAENGVTGVCNWGVYENGVYWEECYCSEDGCNGAVRPGTGSSLLGATFAMLAILLWQLRH
ncbi:hypothetical protein PR048_004022 [Dryococelus australis]|uniref:Protein quiver n=1 Tax=Dryococelus australis TaxID=614101 RepID=A0ABQ9I4D5_9NEOP|nr:hypothetical protein PR048_004022 [Dryococelus australis]